MHAACVECDGCEQDGLPVVVDLLTQRSNRNAFHLVQLRWCMRVGPKGTRRPVNEHCYEHHHQQLEE
jgi:hypothetical protein